MSTLNERVLSESSFVITELEDSASGKNVSWDELGSSRVSVC
jgi:hypothetical protein